MGHPKLKCRGTTEQGKPCPNWAERGSFYCPDHRGEQEKLDRQVRRARGVAIFIVVVLLLVGLLLGLPDGPKTAFMNWF